MPANAVQLASALAKLIVVGLAIEVRKARGMIYVVSSLPSPTGT